MKAIVEQIQGALGSQHIPFHLTEVNSVTSLAALHWWVGQIAYRFQSANLTLVRHHVTESLIIHQSDKDIDLR